MSKTIVSIRNRRSGSGSEPPVLVVEDDATILTEEALPFQLCSNGSEALYRARQNRPLLVILDVHLPSLSGEALATALRIAYGPDLPILLMSASDEARLAASAGAYAYLEKPFDLDEFVSLVWRGVELGAGTSGLGERSRLAQRRIERSLSRQRVAFQQALNEAPPDTRFRIAD